MQKFEIFYLFKSKVGVKVSLLGMKLRMKQHFEPEFNWCLSHASYLIMKIEAWAFSP